MLRAPAPSLSFLALPALFLTRRSFTVRLKIIGNDIIKNVGKYESCMVSKLYRYEGQIILALMVRT